MIYYIGVTGKPIGKEETDGARNGHVPDLRKTVSKEDDTAEILFAGLRTVCQSAQQGDAHGDAECGSDPDIYLQALRGIGESHGSFGQTSQILLAALRKIILETSGESGSFGRGADLCLPRLRENGQSDERL